MYVFFPYKYYGIYSVRCNLTSVYFLLFCRHMEEEILLVATHYIEKDRDLRKKSKVARSGESARRRLVSEGTGVMKTNHCMQRNICTDFIFISFTPHLKWVNLRWAEVFFSIFWNNITSMSDFKFKSLHSITSS